MRIQKPADLARLIKTRRQAKRLTQQDVAAAIGITRQSLARIERGHGGVSFDTVLRIFEHLDIQLDAGNRPDPDIPSQTWTQPIEELQKKDAVTSLSAPKTDPKAITRNIDVAALARSLSSVDTQALARAHIRNLNSSAIAAAATAASRNTGTDALLSSWQHTLSRLTTQLQEKATHTGGVLSERQARSAILRAAIEAGDPDLKPSQDARGTRLPENANEVSHD